MQRTSRIAIGLSMAVLAGCAAAAAATPEEELRQLERDWCTASMTADAAGISKILADDYSGVTSRGIKQTKAEALADLKDPQSSVDSCGETDVKVRLYGDTAVVTGLGSRSGTAKGVAYTDRRILWTDTFVRKAGRWQCVASQGTLVASQQK
jgi:ketosteroid isomerase-like protein